MFDYKFFLKSSRCKERPSCCYLFSLSRVLTSMYQESKGYEHKFSSSLEERHRTNSMWNLRSLNESGKTPVQLISAWKDAAGRTER